MFVDIREKIMQKEKLFFTILPFIPILIIFVNSITLKSFFIGIPALFIYLFVNGEILGRAFFEEEGSFFKFVFGLFTFIALLALTGMLAVLVFRIEIWYLFGMIFAAITNSLLNHIFVKYNRSQRKTIRGNRPFLKSLFIKAIYISYIISFATCFLILLNERSGWVLAKPSIWVVIPPSFLRLYFIATAILVTMVLLPGKITLKLLLIVLHSTFSLLFVPIILYPGVLTGDAWYELGRARSMLTFLDYIFQFPLVRALNTLLKGMSAHVLIVNFAGAANVDLYWSYVVLVPMLWGFFVPLTSYKLTEMIGGGKRASIFAALLSIPNLYFLAWGKLSTSNSLGYVFFFLLLYLLLRLLSAHKTRLFFPLFITLVATTAAHFLPALMAFSFMVLVFALKKYEHVRLKFPRIAYIFLFLSFALSIFIEPVAIVGRGILLPMIGESSFNVNKILRTSIWELVFGISQQTPIQEALLYNLLFPVLGLIGLVYALQRKAKFNRTLCLFMFLAFGVSIIDHRIREYGMIGGLFGAVRLNVFRDMIALPFVAVVINSAVKSLSGTVMKTRSLLKRKNILIGVLACIGLSSWVTVAVYETYRSYTWGLMPTSFELEAIKYIDEHAEGNYVVFAPMDTGSIAWGFIGYPYPPGKNYVGVPSYIANMPSITDMYDQMKNVSADVAYFIAPSFRLANFDKIVKQASRTLGLFTVLSNENGEIYIFDYKIPPLPRGPDVMAFYWDTPAGYFIQNDLMRIIINPASKSLDVVDFWGDLYESIELNNTLVGGNPVGNLTLIEYFDVINNGWVEWLPNVTIPSANKFQFKLRFESESLIGLVERGKGSVQLQSESGQACTLSLELGNFKRLYIPGLIGGEDSYDVNSREYGLLYTRNLTDSVVLQPAYKPDIKSTSLTYNQIVKYCNFTLTKGYMGYDLYVHNNASMDQWVYVEVWLPDQVSVGVWPPLYFSPDDGKTWVYAPYDYDLKRSIPLTTLGGVDVNWIFSVPRFYQEKPTHFWSSWPYKEGEGGSPKLPENYTDSGGAQDRIFFGFYLPAKDKVLVRLGSGVYSPRPFVVSYFFRDSDNIAYGVRNMKEGLIKFYNFGVSEYVGGITFTNLPTSLVIAQDETGTIKSMRMILPSNTTFSLLSRKGVDTSIDQDADGIPDLI